MKRLIFFVLLICLSVILWVRIPQTDAASSGIIKLNPGDKLTIRANLCALVVSKYIPLNVKVKCVGNTSGNAVAAGAPNARIILSAGQSQIVKANQCALTIAKNTTTLVRIRCNPATAPICWAQNNSYGTKCAEEDNINVPLFGSQVKKYRIVATHPAYDVGTDNCNEDFSGCQVNTNSKNPYNDSCFDDPANKMFDDHDSNAIWGCLEPNWNRPYTMHVTMSGLERDVHRIVWLKKIQDNDQFPQFFVLYENGYARVKPHPPTGRIDNCFGSSVVIGPAVALSSRPYADIDQVLVNPDTMSLDLTYKNGGTAHITLSVDRTRAVAEVDADYPTSNTMPFTVFRSMHVADGNADVDHIQTVQGDFSIESNWAPLTAKWWFFHRLTRSTHNTSAPDIRIEVVQ